MFYLAKNYYNSMVESGNTELIQEHPEITEKMKQYLISSKFINMGQTLFLYAELCRYQNKPIDSYLDLYQLSASYNNANAFLYLYIQ